MTVDNRTVEPAGGADDAYEPPALTRFGAIEAWTLGMPGLVNISIIL